LSPLGLSGAIAMNVCRCDAVRCSALGFVGWFVFLGASADWTSTAEGEEARLNLKTERVIVFKDGYALVLRRGIATTDEDGQLFTDEVPDAAVLGSFWATPREGTLTAVVAGMVEEKQVEETQTSCLQTIEILKANIGKPCTVLMSNQSSLTGEIREVLARTTDVPMTDAFLTAASSTIDARLTVRNSLVANNQPARTRMISQFSGTHMVLRTKEGDVLLPVDQIQRVTIENMATKLARTATTTTQTKRLTFRFTEAGKRREILLAYFRPGFRWIPTYRVNLTRDEKKQKIAELSMQAEILNEAEDLVDTPIDIVVGVPNFRFRTLPSPLILERTLHNALAQAAPHLMGQQYGNNAFSNALFSQRGGERHRPAQRGNVATSTAIELPVELTTARNQELFVYSLPKLNLYRGQRAAVSVFNAKVPYSDIYSWSVHAKRHDIATAPSGSGVASPLVLSKNDVWRNIVLSNTTNVPWTTGAVMIMQGHQPLAQELLTYTPPKSLCRVPVTVAVDIQGRFSEKETGRSLKALRWDGYDYAKINQRAELFLHSAKQETVEIEVTARFGGRADEVTDEGKIVLSPYRAEDWQNYRGQPAVNNSSTVSWRIQLAPGKSFEPTVDYHFYTRH
jgi:hypothetical protein